MTEIKRFIITTDNQKNNHAGTKGRNDVEAIAFREGYRSIHVREVKGKGLVFRLVQLRTVLIDWIGAARVIENGSYLLIQAPIGYARKYVLIILKLLRSIYRIKITIIIQDLDYMRDITKDPKTEMQTLKLAEYIICHNDKMKVVLIAQGLQSEKLISLTAFDYLTENELALPKRRKTSQVIIAGNLERDKAGFVYKLSEVKGRLTFHLYGPNYELKQKATGTISETVNFMGEFSPQEVFYRMEGSFGLIWDGDSIETCAGAIGVYLRINNPNKTSLYLAAGLPVIVWSESAMADFVRKEQIGIAVKSLNDLDEAILKLSDANYDAMLENVSRVSEKIRAGYYTKTALEKTLSEQENLLM